MGIEIVLVLVMLPLIVIATYPRHEEERQRPFDQEVD